MDRETAATLISTVLHPLAVPAPAGIFVLVMSRYSVFEASAWIGLVLLTVVAPMFLIVSYLEKFHGLDTDERAPRNSLYPLGLLFVVVSAVLLKYLSGPEIILLGLYMSIIAGIAGLLINRRTKISLHTGVMSGISAVAFHVSVTAGISLMVLTVLVGWSRIHLDRHTPQQVMLGFSVPILAAGVVFIAL